MGGRLCARRLAVAIIATQVLAEGALGFTTLVLYSFIFCVRESGVLLQMAMGQVMFVK
jgi:hypothetical protein